MWMILNRDSAKKIHFSTDWSKHYIFLNITVNYRLSNDAITECGSQHLNCILLIFFRKWGQLVTHHLIMFCCDWLVFNSYDWCILYSTGWITKALFSSILTHYYAKARPIRSIFMLQNALIFELVCDILHRWVWLIWWVAVVPSHKNKPSLWDGIPYLVREKYIGVLSLVTDDKALRKPLRRVVS